jgi:hypothetical protein
MLRRKHFWKAACPIMWGEKKLAKWFLALLTSSLITDTCLL